MASLNGYIIQVSTESIGNSVDIPRYPVEEGIAIIDHVEQIPQTLTLSGTVTKPSKEEVDNIISTFEGYMNSGELITYEGRRIYSGMLIESFECNADSTIANGHNFSMTLTKVRITNSSIIKLALKATTDAGKKQIQNKASTPTRKHVVRAGDTYYSLGKKYGIPWQKIKEMNGYPERAIPIGVKLRVS